MTTDHPTVGETITDKVCLMCGQPATVPVPSRTPGKFDHYCAADFGELMWYLRSAKRAAARANQPVVVRGHSPSELREAIADARRQDRRRTGADRAKTRAANRKNARQARDNEAAERRAEAAAAKAERQALSRNLSTAAVDRRLAALQEQIDDRIVEVGRIITAKPPLGRLERHGATSHYPEPPEPPMTPTEQHAATDDPLARLVAECDAAPADIAYTPPMAMTEAELDRWMRGES